MRTKLTIATVFSVLILFSCNSCEKSGKILPNPNIKGNVRIMEEIDFNSYGYGVSDDGLILDYESGWRRKHKHLYNESGYEIEAGYYYTDSYSDYRYSYDFDDEDTSYKYTGDNGMYIYNKHGNITDYYHNNKKESHYEYDEKQREISYTVYDEDGNINTKRETIYDGITITERSRYNEDGELKKGGTTIITTDEDGNKLESKEYSYNDKLINHVVYRFGGKEAIKTDYDVDGIKFTISNIEYNSNGDVIKEAIYYVKTRDTQYNEIRWEYDHYGNPTLRFKKTYSKGPNIPTEPIENPRNYEEYSKMREYELAQPKYYITIWNYEYYDGTKFIAQQEYPELFKRKSSRIETNEYNDNRNTNNEDNRKTIVIEHQHDPVPMQVWVQCGSCGPTGLPGQCPICHGTGTTYSGNYQCISCNGSGRCSFCNGTGGHYEVQYR